MRHDYAIYALTGPGAALARKIAARNGGQVFLPAALRNAREDEAANFYFQRLGESLAENWFQYSCQVFICASGIALRAMAPLLCGKDLDPAVILLDQDGRFVISLLGGHLAEANRLAAELAGQIGATPVISTATDSAGLPAIDLLAAATNLRLVNLKAARAINSAWLRGEKVPLFDPLNRLGLSEAWRSDFFLPLSEASLKNPETLGPAVLITDRGGSPINENILYLENKKLWLGLGCRRGVKAAELRRFARHELGRAGYHPRDLAGLASLELKQDEPALLDLAAAWELPLRFFSATELDHIAVPTPSQRVKQATGTASVCEAAALLAVETSGNHPADLILTKRKGKGLTLALAGPRAYE